MITCTNCNSTGRVDLPVVPGRTYAEQADCPVCKGLGRVQEVSPADPQPPVEMPPQAAPAPAPAPEQEIPKDQGVTGSSEDSSNGEVSSESTPIMPE